MNQKLPDSRKGTRQTSKYISIIKILKAIKDRLISFLNFSLLITGSQIRFSVLNICNKNQFRKIFPALINKINALQSYLK